MEARNRAHCSQDLVAHGTAAYLHDPSIDTL